MSQRAALCIGINNYPGTNMDLRGCVNDMNDWAAELDRRGYGVSTLQDAAATREGMRGAMAKLLSDARSGDALVITFSGHGSYTPDEDGDESDGYDEGLCGYDVTAQGPLIDDEIRELFASRRKGVRVLLISDSCHSGSVTRAAPGVAGEVGAQALRARFLPMANWLPPDRPARAAPDTPGHRVRPPPAVSPFQSVLRKAAGDLLLSGCEEGPDNYSYDAWFRDRPNGALTYYALKTLRRLPADATYAQWHAAICEHLPSLHHAQAPQLFGSARAKRRVVLQ